MSIKVAAGIFILYVYQTLSEISYAVSRCVPTGKIATFTDPNLIPMFHFLIAS